jgi:hypothetical protein
MRELKPGMKVKIEPPADFVGSTCDSHILDDFVYVKLLQRAGHDPRNEIRVPASWCKPVLPEIGVGDEVSIGPDGDHGLVIQANDYFRVAFWDGVTARYDREHLTLVRKASYSDVTDE